MYPVGGDVDADGNYSIRTGRTLAASSSSPRGPGTLAPLPPPGLGTAELLSAPRYPTSAPIRPALCCLGARADCFLSPRLSVISASPPFPALRHQLLVAIDQDLPLESGCSRGLLQRLGYSTLEGSQSAPQHHSMSLNVDDGRRGGRSRSRSRDRRPVDEPPPEPTTYADLQQPTFAYPDDDLDGRYRSSRRAPPSQGGGLPYPADAGFDSMLPGNQGLYSYDDDRRPIYRTASPAADSPYRTSRDKVESKLPGSFPADDRYGDPRDSKYDLKDSQGLDHDKLKFLPQKYSRGYDDDDDKVKRDKYGRRYEDDDADGKDKDKRRSRTYEDEDYGKYSDREKEKRRERQRKKEALEDDLAYGRPPGPRPDSPPTTYGSYIPTSQTGDKRSSRYDDPSDRRRPASPGVDEHGRPLSYRDDPRSSGANVLTVEPNGRDRDRRRDKSPGPSQLGVEPTGRVRDRSRDRRDGGRDRSPLPPTARMSNLSVDTGRPAALTLAAAPGSPFLESYRGTYQESSPMPSPLLLASGYPDEYGMLEPLSPLTSDAEGDGKRRSRRARFHDPEDIATRLARALKGDKSPDVEPLIEILPSLTHEQVMELRAEYKRLVKTGSERKGVNIAKHIRSRLKDEDPNLMKACYSVALGKWESEAYWANFWYQGDKTRRELLIESLMGRTNDEIHEIKDSFTDKKYDNSLTKCMRTELKEDKFKKAVMTVLEERRMEEYDSTGRRLPLDYELIDRDVADLRKVIKSDKGGESLMISIIVSRSDSHLRAVLKEYEKHYRSNFARDSLKRSGNLVGELLAHILNGVINRPVRDALLLHHALTASRKDDLRRELLTSRLVRFHWDPMHMHAVKKAYRERYGHDLQDAVRDATSGAWGLFCSELCIARMPNDVRRVERVDARR
ncbi:hypothetical protein S40288_03174 [Stachybotrys chartarum IBT 40288]|nr:hypothetical protein S40288_03174 [Stachybotrys chartarum IBT 40288]